MKQHLLIPVALLLAGCGATVNKTYLPDGQQGYAVDCSGAGAELIDCYEKAGNVCGASGYEVVGASGVGYASRAMLIKCQ
jgi:hypothetical protein